MEHIKLYVDDLRDCPKGYKIARTAEEALDILRDKNIHVDVLSLDHDLGEENGVELTNGFGLVVKMGEEGLYADNIYIHTMNPVGREKMYTSLLSFKRHKLIPETVNVYNYSITEDKYTEQ